MKILVTGSNGLLGQKLTDLLVKKGDIQLIATARGENRNPLKSGYIYEQLDILDEEATREIIVKHRPDCVIHGAAMTQVDDCETKQIECIRLNINTVEHLIELSVEFDFRLVHLSTDFIFDGTKAMLKEEDIARPLSFYGWSKLEAENRILEMANNYAIIRTVLVYGNVADMSRSNIILWAYNTLKEQKAAKVVDDQFRTPTLAEDLAVGCFLAAMSKENGIFNIAGNDFLSIYELVQMIAAMYGFSMDRIERVSSSTLNQPAKRPPITGLNIEKAQRILGYQPHSLSEGIRLCLAEFS
jgi:dTDP-4-dehydrorhamnose reductase